MSLPSLPTYLQALAILVAGVLQTLTLAPFGWWFLGPLSIVLLLFATGALQPKAQARPLLYGWLFGIGLFSSGASWVYISIHTHGHAPPVLATILTMAFVAGLALFHALMFWCFYRLRTPSTLLNGLLFIGLWVLADGFRTIFLTGFPWLFLGYGHLASPLAGWVPVVGVYGIGLIVIATGVVIYDWLTFRRHTHASTLPRVITTLLVTACWISGPLLSDLHWTQKKAPQLSVALIQTNIPQAQKWLPSQRRKTLKLLEQMSSKHWQADVIIWPETAVPILFDQAQPFLDSMSDLAASHETNLITGIPFRHINKASGETTLHNSIFSFGAGSGINHKQKLVPFGEYVPLQNWLRGLIAFFDLPMSDFRKGPKNQNLLNSHDFKAAPFICYEVVYPDFVAERSVQADYLLTISNDSWFGASIGPLQHLEMAQMRAAENSRYMIRGTNNGISAIIDNRGQLVAQTEQFVRTSLEAPFELHTGRTPFSRFGSIPVFALSLILVLSAFFARRKAQ